MDRALANRFSPGALTYLIHHIFLPPKLPQEDDHDPEYESVLLNVVLDALGRFRNCVIGDQNETIGSVIAMISGMISLRDSSASADAVSERKLESALRALCKKVGSGTILLHIRAQNTGVMVSRVDQSIHVEVFELSPLNEPVVTTKGRLRRSFPGLALSLSIDNFEQPGFQSTIARTLAKMSHQLAAGTKPKARKAGRLHDEDRDTIHPQVVTELFMGFLAPAAEPVDVSCLWKNTREEVMWLDSLLPWRRSPTWLLVRVAMQLVISRSCSSSASRGYLYKRFMVFLMSHILELSHRHSLPSDLLYTVNAKLTRRLLKLDPHVGTPVLSFAQNVMQNTYDQISTRWSHILKQASPCRHLSCLEHLSFDRDIFHTLVGLDEYVKSLAKRGHHKVPLSFQPASQVTKFQIQELPTHLDSSIPEHTVYNLRAFEDWVTSNLPQWLEHQKGSAGTCGKIGESIRNYYRAASPFYAGNPEANSIMLLTILELWIACDKSAISACEFLRDYDPGIPLGLLQSLLLPLACQMERVLHVERYLEQRQVHAVHPSPSIFRDYGLQNCFSVRYFSQSPEHRTLLRDIECEATQAKQEKLREFSQKKEEYRSLMRRVDQSECEYEVRADYYNGIYERRYHSDGCQKCKYRSQADSLTIRIHEWPLPDDALEAKSVVFELKVPPFFGHWRDTTLFLLLTVLNARLSADGPRAHYHLRGYQGLSSFFASFSTTQRLGLLSENKPHEVTHRWPKNIATTTPDDVCLNSGLWYKYHDEATGTFVGDFCFDDDLLKPFIYTLPTPSASIQRFLFRPATAPNGPSPNTVIASQSDCPDCMSLDEYKALCTIPLGTRIQWQNILLQLCAPSVDFKKVETTFVVLQSIYQAGPPSGSAGLRESHNIVGDADFCHALLESLHEALQRIKENWESSQALSIFTSLAARLLSLSTADQVKTRCLIYLANVRDVAFAWVNLLKDRVHKTTVDCHRTDLISKAVEIALICIDSFNVDDMHLVHALSSSKDASVFIQCSIIIHEGINTILKTSDPMIPILHRRWRWLSYRAYPILMKEISNARSQSLDDAIRKSWSAYQVGGCWQVVSEQANYWVVSQTPPRNNCEQLWVHFNILTGELLVNGLPLNRLPSEFERHATYRTLFGHSTLEVMPSAAHGMQFSGKKEYAGYTLHFGISPVPGTSKLLEHDLLVQAEKNNCKYELIPCRVLRGEFPDAFVEEFVHWYDVNDGSLEFRPVGDPWLSSPNNWRLTRARGVTHWLMRKGAMSSVSVKSETAVRLSDILSPLEDPLKIHIALHHSSSSLEIELPRLQLGFDLRSGESSIQSKQFRGMPVDPYQSLGTLVGLRNKLLLKHKTNDGRLVILPEGGVSWEKDGDHVCVIIDKNSAAKAHAYYVDTQIGRLVDNGSLQSKLFLCYLHALTSFCLPDPHIQRTGTEEALSILNSAAVRSFDRLTQENIDILRRIAYLTPGRGYYPANERVMQTVEWVQELSFLAQHGGFYENVTSIFNQADKAKMFYPESYVPSPDLDHVDPFLSKRDSIRSSTFRVSGFGAEDHTSEHDATYSARDRDNRSARRLKALAMSDIVYHGRTKLHYNVPSDLAFHLWNFLSRSDSPILGASHPIPSELDYDGELLQDSPEIVSKYWCTLHQTISRDHPRWNKFRLMIWLSTLAFAEKSDMQIVQTLASFFVVPEMVQISAPPITSFRLSYGAAVNTRELHTSFRSALLPFHRCPEGQLSRGARESSSNFNRRQQRQFQSNQDRTVNKLVNAMQAQWPCETPTPPNDAEFSLYMDMDKVIEAAMPKFKVWFDNYRFYDYLCQIRDTLSLQLVNPVEVPSSSLTTPTWNLQRTKGFIGIDDVFSCSPPSELTCGSRDLNDLLLPSNVEKSTPRLASLLDRLETQLNSNYERKYVEDLRVSLCSLRGWRAEYHLWSQGNGVEGILRDHLNRCSERVRKIYSAIMSAVTEIHAFEGSSTTQRNNPLSVAVAIRQIPRLCPVLFLQQLARSRWQIITTEWKRCIVQYALALTELQRAERLVNLSDCHADLIKEIRNSGHRNWDPIDYPESLLLEAETGIIIRDVQEEIAREMRGPQHGNNAVMQLNMGEGKSSVIVPIVAVALADTSRLVRVIVAKPQSKQMFQMLVSKLGGLLNRRVYHMPFSRSLKLGIAEANTIASICLECMTNGGILLVQPEHILSFKLMGLECLLTGKDAIGRSLLDTQKYFDTSTRDIVDESDENFSVKFELIYTMGMQQPVELSPERWICVQQMLELVKMFAPEVLKEHPLSMEVHERCPGSFPRTRILGYEAQERILGNIAERLCETGLNGFPIARQPEAVRKAVYKYITKTNLTANEVDQVESQYPGGFWTESTSKTLLLFRGLIGGGVLAFAFGQKRWRVNYGLDATRNPRTRLAVPYRAKDSPTPRSEFSHPDVVIILTLLSHYYSGLGDDDLFLAFGHLLKSDQADIEYQVWVKDAPSLPPAFRQLAGVNLKDRFQCVEQVFPPLRYAKSVVDYFLAHIVFPKEMKEFPHKLSASGWDIGQIKTHPTTGFIGTNDSRMTLPLPVKHLDLQEQKHTNALVLEHLLQPENSVVLMPQRGKPHSSDAEILLTMVTKMDPAPQVILDVGAQILELKNLELARQWLEMTPDLRGVQAVVFFDDSDELSDLDRKGKIEALQTSTFAKQLDVCLIFLDEAHTRGTDLRLPEYYKAAVTLGANLTKDRLVQACMRMRKLGEGQSVVFCVPEEIEIKIQKHAANPENAVIDVSDVLCWAMSETWTDMRRSMPLWAAQGKRFEHQNALWAEARCDGEVRMSQTHAERFLEKESRSLDDMYRPCTHTDMTSALQVGGKANLGLIWERCREFDALEFNLAELQEEQERELSPEIEEERQIQKPQPADPADHHLHPDLITFTTTGTLISGSKAYMPAFEALRDTSAAAHLDVSQFPDDLFVTADFSRTVQIRGNSYISDVYQRPVQWILTSTGSDCPGDNAVKYMVIISPYEAQELQSTVGQSKTVVLHLYAPRLNLGFRALDGLDLFTVPKARGRVLPRRLVMLLNIFAGQLHLSSFKEYVEICALLELASEKTKVGCVVAADGFIIRDCIGTGEPESGSAFRRSPVPFLKVLMSKIRRNCQSIDKTHMGTILDGRLLRPSDFGVLEAGQDVAKEGDHGRSIILS
ncbi:uncharacterized protein A1O5_07780 [Cladophialophora psammophila CBS 110553]|uniref:ubiquitinyl hydrolase 1 n=1 Tax=Cladophialophora psammophila CBS 110553 TaxID=1182543 RepID=W9WLW0_9EURO|nr:uncharacterized protein A1O5_07780 [Cladophialophora psammophila CBS 110553]EXJ68848.1 hypothetical protein A1O5_07780 [Cladophialophora psammophila CBS 110553]